MFSWLQCKQEYHGPVVCWLAALFFLLASALGLAVLFAVIGFSMWISPYLTAMLSLILVTYLIYRQN
jgi:hypothetical protein